ncbi:MAG: GH3 auxin-responsive promoter family protein [Cyanobacteriota bacterium]|nr:GH3 auxin-responsive promoter family protein [Cyanobacteriota bacterium]
MKHWQHLQDKLTPCLEQFLTKLQHPEAVQQQLLKTILAKNKETIFGQKYNFSSIDNYRQFSTAIPIQTYEDLSPYIERMAAGETNILSAEELIAFETTGGSTTGAKLIPFTTAGLTAIQKAIFPWLGDLLKSRPGIKKGRTYWAISPVTRRQTKTAGGINIGMSDDAAYFGEELAIYIGQLLAIPPEFALITDMDEWRYLTALFLLAAEDLTLISVWSPTFLLELIEEMKNKSDRLLKDIATGKDNLPANPGRAKLLETALSKETINAQKIWQQLDTISCWTDASAKAFIPEMQEIFPDVFIQGKGLLATEGVVSLPLADCSHPVLAINSGFYEFIDAENKPHLCHELIEGEVYRILITTEAGLYRYELGDRLKVRGWKGRTPLLEFMGRSGIVSDLCGEKLTEEFVLDKLANIRGFRMLAPSAEGKPHYALFLDSREYGEKEAVAICKELDKSLEANPQYQYARQLKQLGEIQPYLIENPMNIYLDRALGRGQRLGDIKPPVLSRETGWESRFMLACL